jgi:hypothetical protein
MGQVAEEARRSGGEQTHMGAITRLTVVFRLRGTTMVSGLLALILVGYTLLFLVGLARFATSNAGFEVALPRTAENRETTPDMNLVALAMGPILRASSFERDVHGLAHPAYLVDGRARPTETEKWAPRFDDRAPWLEFVFREPRHVRRVVLRHARHAQAKMRAHRAYRIQCMSSGEVLEITRNKESVATHELDCPRATGVRIDFETPRGKAPSVYEVEVYGR